MECEDVQEVTTPIHLSQWGQIIISSVMPIFGLIGCVIIILVMKRPYFANTVFAVHMISVAIIDMIRFIADVTEILHIFIRIEFFCTAKIFLNITSALASYNIVAIIAVERMLAVIFPLKFKMYSTIPMARLAFFISIILGA